MSFSNSSHTYVGGPETGGLHRYPYERCRCLFGENENDRFVWPFGGAAGVWYVGVGRFVASAQEEKKTWLAGHVRRR